MPDLFAAPAMLKPSSYSSLTELTHTLGVRTETSKHIGILHNTLYMRMSKPGTFLLPKFASGAASP